MIAIPKRAKRILAVLLPVLVGIGVLAWIAQAITGTRMHHRIRAAAAESDSMVLQRYYGREIIESSEMDAEAFLAWMDGSLVPLSAPIDISMCWKPHHRILLRGDEGSRSVEICFGCDLFEFESGPRKLPKPWRQAFRELFSKHGIPPEMPSETEIEAAQARFAE
ncbi:MAG TPA: hypothetical protein PLA50_13785 [Bacteroidia bacterium]|nr:hypothetical protein [Bacteroidia bacterium]